MNTDDFPKLPDDPEVIRCVLQKDWRMLPVRLSVLGHSRLAWAAACLEAPQLGAAGLSFRLYRLPGRLCRVAILRGAAGEWKRILVVESETVAIETLSVLAPLEPAR